MRPILAGLLLSLCASQDASASSDAAAFRAYEDQYFYLYSQTAMTGFTCQMSLNTINDLVLGLRAKIDAGELPMEMKDSLESTRFAMARAWWYSLAPMGVQKP